MSREPGEHAGRACGMLRNGEGRILGAAREKLQEARRRRGICGKDGHCAATKGNREGHVSGQETSQSSELRGRAAGGRAGSPAEPRKRRREFPASWGPSPGPHPRRCPQGPGFRARLKTPGRVPARGSWTGAAGTPGPRAGSPTTLFSRHTWPHQKSLRTSEIQSVHRIVSGLNPAWKAFTFHFDLNFVQFIATCFGFPKKKRKTKENAEPNSRALSPGSCCRSLRSPARKCGHRRTRLGTHWKCALYIETT